MTEGFAVLMGMRKPRITCAGAIYHVVARANRKENILKPDEIKNDFLEVMRRAKKKFRFTVTSFCIMSNHIHIMITPAPGESISRIMQWILSVFAIRYNKRFALQGHVWYDRFKSRIIDGLRNFLRVFRYIAENPVKAGIVKKAWEYPFSSLAYMRKAGIYSCREDAPLSDNSISKPPPRAPRAFP